MLFRKSSLFSNLNLNFAIILGQKLNNGNGVVGVSATTTTVSMKTDDSGIVADKENNSSYHSGNDNNKSWSHKREQSMQSLGGDSVREMAEKILDNLYDSLTTEESASKKNGGRLVFFFNLKQTFLQKAKGNF